MDNERDTHTYVLIGGDNLQAHLGKRVEVVGTVAGKTQDMEQESSKKTEAAPATAGGDTYTGNGGADIYDYTFAVSAMDGDTITDFDSDDVIDLSSNNASANGSGPLRKRAASVSPSMYSITRHSTPSRSATSYSTQMLGCFSEATVCASRFKRAHNSASAAASADRILIATGRLSRESVAR